MGYGSHLGNVFARNIAVFLFPMWAYRHPSCTVTSALSIFSSHLHSVVFELQSSAVHLQFEHRRATYGSKSGNVFGRDIVVFPFLKTFFVSVASLIFFQGFGMFRTRFHVVALLQQGGRTRMGSHADLAFPDRVAQMKVR